MATLARKLYLSLILCVLVFVIAACELVNPVFTITCVDFKLSADSATATVDTGGGYQTTIIRGYDGNGTQILNTSYNFAVNTTIGSFTDALFPFSTPPAANPITIEIMSPAGGALAVDTVWYTIPGSCATLYTAPIITSAAAVTVANNTSFSHTFTATGDPAPTLSYVADPLPAGVTLVGDLLSGTPTVSGIYTIQVTASNGVSPDPAQTFTLTVEGDAPVITSAAAVTVANNTSFSHTFTATGDPAPTLSYSGINLPPGVTLVGDLLSGTPTVSGIYTIQVTASNGVSPDAAQTFTLTVEGDAPVITSASTVNVEQENYVAHTFMATGNPAPTLSYSDINLPPGVTLTGDALAGYPELSGTFGLTVTASNGVDPDAVQHFALVIGSLPEAPPLPFAEDVNFLEAPTVRTGVPNALYRTILVRTLYQNGESTRWLGSDMYNYGSIGIQGVVDLGVWQAIDLSGAGGVTYFEGGATFCLYGEGTLIWMSAANTPRIAEIIGSYTVPEFTGYTCATLFEPGTLVLVQRNPLS